MPAPRRPEQRPQRPKAKSPAERGAEFAEAQRNLKQEAADRRDAKAKDTSGRKRRSS
jgi:hypothetical protein